MNFKKIIHNLIGNKRVLLIIDIILILVAIKGYKSIYNKEYLKNTFEIQSEKFVKENETPVFSLKKVIIYSSAHADDVGEDDVSQLVNISQFTDIALYIDNTGKTTELNEENTISEMFIDNIKITPMPDNQNRIINFKNSIDYGKYVDLSNYEEDGIVFNVLHNNEDRQNSVDGNVFYTDCSNPIVLGYLNKDLLTNCRIGADRTGTLAYLLEGVLGVPTEYRYQDYELTTFFGLRERTRYYYMKDSTNDMYKFIYLKKAIRHATLGNDEITGEENVIDWFLLEGNSTSECSDITALINQFRAKMIDYN